MTGPRLLGMAANVDTRLARALGLDSSPLVDCGADGLLLPEAGRALQRLRERANRAGFNLCVASGYRSYQRQLSIFNAKAVGERAIVDEAGRILRPANLSAKALLAAILRFSALPGVSRHHWGTDVDVWDSAAVNADYQLALTTDEYADGGVFSAMSQWLDERIAADDAEGFFRPYASDSGGVAPEPWHLSYRPGAQGLATLQSLENLLPLWRADAQAAEWGITAPLALLETLEQEAEGILARYKVIDELLDP